MPKGNSLTSQEVGIIKKLLSLNKYSNQEIAGLINRFRGDPKNDINSGRITNIRKNEILQYNLVLPCSDQEIEFFFKKIASWDGQTGLNLYDHERLIRAREAMILAVYVFNSPGVKFKTEIFAVLANIAWTYLLHEFFEQKMKEKIIRKDNKTISLGEMLEKTNCPLSKNVKNNLESIIAIRHEVEHKLFSRADPIFFSKFQANALNFDKTIRELFGEKLSLNSELSLALQFSKLQLDQIKVLQEYDVPPSIQALDAQLNSNLTEEEKESIEYQFKVIYSLESSSKSKNHFQFIQPGSVEGKQIHNILTKLKFADDHYPYRTKDVCSEIINKTGEKFNQHHHRQAWSLYQIRPKGGAKNPENTNKEFCVYNKVWKGYSYSQSWVDYLVECIKDKEKYEDILAHKP